MRVDDAGKAMMRNHGLGAGGRFGNALSRCGAGCLCVNAARMNHQFVHSDRVQFADTDMAGIMHFANFFRFMERAEHAFFRSLGLSVFEKNDGASEDEPVGWPRVNVTCDYLSPLHFEDEVEVEVLIEEIRTRAIRFLFRIRKKDGILAAEGHITTVCVRKDEISGKMRAVEIPGRILAKIAAAPAEKLARPA